MSLSPLGGRKFDEGKARFDLITPEFEEGLALVLTYGAEMHAPENWKGLDPNRCYAALRRHISEWRSGEKKDPDTGLSHLYHATCNLMFLDWFDKHGQEEDVQAPEAAPAVDEAITPEHGVPDVGPVLLVGGEPQLEPGGSVSKMLRSSSAASGYPA